MKTWTFGGALVGLAILLGLISGCVTTNHSMFVKAPEVEKPVSASAYYVDPEGNIVTPKNYEVIDHFRYEKTDVGKVGGKKLSEVRLDAELEDIFNRSQADAVVNFQIHALDYSPGNTKLVGFTRIFGSFFLVFSIPLLIIGFTGEEFTSDIFTVGGAVMSGIGAVSLGASFLLPAASKSVWKIGFEGDAVRRNDTRVAERIQTVISQPERTVTTEAVTQPEQTVTTEAKAEPPAVASAAESAEEVEESVERRVFMIPTKTIILDGKLDDWTDLKPLFVDKVGDSEGEVRGTDIKEAYLAKDASNLFVRFDLADAQFLSVSSAARFGYFRFQFSHMFDETRSLEYQVYYNRDSGGWRGKISIYNAKSRTSSDLYEGKVRKTNKGFEGQFPLRSVQKILSKSEYTVFQGYIQVGYKLPNNKWFDADTIGPVEITY